MMMTKVNNMAHLNKFQRRQIAQLAHTQSLAPKPVISLVSARLFPAFAQVSYICDSEPKNGFVTIDNLYAFLQQVKNLLPQTDVDDISPDDYIEDNLERICEAYLVAGKEVML